MTFLGALRHDRLEAPWLIDAQAVRRAIRQAGARLFFLPKYSPDLNPIEQFFAKLKHWLRKAAGQTVEAVCEAIGPILNRLTSAECANYLAHAGYGQPRFTPL